VSKDLLPGPNVLTLQTCAARPLQNESSGSNTSTSSFGAQLLLPHPLLCSSLSTVTLRGADASACRIVLQPCLVPTEARAGLWAQQGGRQLGAQG